MTGPPPINIDSKNDAIDGSVSKYARHGREFMGCGSTRTKSPVFSSGLSNGSHHTRWIAHKKLVRGEGNCGRATDRGEEACETMGKHRVCRLPSVRQFPTRMVSHQDLPGYEQKLHLRPTTPGECAVQHEAELEDGAEVDGELGQGSFTFLSGEICRAYP